MRFGIYCEIQTPPGKSYYDMIWEIMRQIEHADDMGFDVYSVIDHHFFQKFSISANPLAMFAAAAQRTQRIRFRTALHTLPLETSSRMAAWSAASDADTPGSSDLRPSPWKKAARATTRRSISSNSPSQRTSSPTTASFIK
jgi:hypothetical protein